MKITDNILGMVLGSEKGVRYIVKAVLVDLLQRKIDLFEGGMQQPRHVIVCRDMLADVIQFVQFFFLLTGQCRGGGVNVRSGHDTALYLGELE